MIIVKQSTAVDVVIGAFVDDTDFKTPKTALTIAQADVQLSKNGGAFAQKSETTTATHLGGGHYKIPLNTTDTNTLGVVRGFVNEATALPVWFDLMVMAANAWDSLFGTDKLQVDAVEWLSGAIATPTVTGVPEVDVTHWRGTAAAAPTTAGIPRVAVEAAGDFAQGAADKVWSSTTRSLTEFSTALALSVWDVLETAIVTASTIGIKVKTNLDVVLSSGIQARLPAALVSGRMDSHVGSVVDGVLTAAKFAAGAFDAVWTVATRTLTSLGAALVQEIWDRATSALTTVGSIGKLLVDNIDAAISSRLSAAGYTAPDNASIATILTRTDVATSTRATPAQVNTEVLDVLNVDTFAEPGQEAPPATTTLVKKIGYSYKAWRNKNELNKTTGIHKLFADDGTTTDQKRLVTDDGTTTTVAEAASGP